MMANSNLLVTAYTAEECHTILAKSTKAHLCFNVFNIVDKWSIFRPGDCESQFSKCKLYAYLGKVLEKTL